MNYTDLFRITLPETVLEIAAVLVLVVDLAFQRASTVRVRAAVASVLGIAGCAAALLFMLGQGTRTFSASTAADTALLSTGGLIAVAQSGILALTAVTLLLFIDTRFTRHPGEYVAVLLMSATGGLVISGAQDLLVIFIGLELLSLGLYVLTAFAKQSGRSAEAALKYYLFGGMSAAFLLFGFSYLYGLTGSTNLQRIAEAAMYSSSLSGPLFYVALVFVAAGLGFKVAAVPFHLWAPDAYEGAPAPAAAFIASVSKVASFALLIGIGVAIASAANANSAQPGGEFASRQLVLRAPWSILLAVLATASMLVGNLAALVQTSVRRLLAYSAIAHAGYMLLALAYPTQSPRSNEALLYYILTYGLTTMGAFGVVGVVERATGSDHLDAFLGLHKRNPLLAAVLLILLLSLAGIPPLVGFWAKFNLFTAVLAANGGVSLFAMVPLLLVALAVGMSAVSLYYYLQVLKRAYVMPAPPEECCIDVRPVTAIVLAFTAAAVLVMGCMPAVLQSWIAGL